MCHSREYGLWGGAGVITVVGWRGLVESDPALTSPKRGAALSHSVRCQNEEHLYTQKSSLLGRVTHLTTQLDDST